MFHRQCILPEDDHHGPLSLLLESTEFRVRDGGRVGLLDLSALEGDFSAGLLFGLRECRDMGIVIEIVMQTR